MEDTRLFIGPRDLMTVSLSVWRGKLILELPDVYLCSHRIQLADVPHEIGLLPSIHSSCCSIMMILAVIEYSDIKRMLYTYR